MLEKNWGLPLEEDQPQGPQKQGQGLINIAIGLSFSAAAAALITATLLHNDEHAQQVVKQSTPESTVEAALVESRQTVRTYFVGMAGTNTEVINWRPVDAPAYTEHVDGDFSASEKYRYNFIIDKYESRSRNALVSFTSDIDIDTLKTDSSFAPYITVPINVPEDARVVALDKLSSDERDKFRNIYISQGTLLGETNVDSQRQSIPAGLLDPSLYLNNQVDGYGIETWGERYNAWNSTDYFKDVAGAFDDKGIIAGKKMVLDAFIEDEGKYCRFEYLTDKKSTNSPSNHNIVKTPQLIIIYKTRQVKTVHYSVICLIVKFKVLRIKPLLLI
jgi:hypothetical protein